MMLFHVVGEVPGDGWYVSVVAAPSIEEAKRLATESTPSGYEFQSAHSLVEGRDVQPGVIHTENLYN